MGVFNQDVRRDRSNPSPRTEKPSQPPSSSRLKGGLR